MKSYQERVTPWAIARLGGTEASRIIGRFKRRVDAEGHQIFLSRYIPLVTFVVIYDP